MPDIGTVETTRYGPNKVDAYSWTVSFTSTLGTTSYCGSASCFDVYDSTSSAVSVTGCSNDDLEGLYLSDSYVDGRRSYFLASSPFKMYYDVFAQKWVIADWVTSSVVTQSTATNDFTVPFASGWDDCTVAASSSSPVLNGMVNKVLLVTGQEPSLENSVERLVNSRV
jgi:hypothetical protein